MEERGAEQRREEGSREEEKEKRRKRRGERAEKKEQRRKRSIQTLCSGSSMGNKEITELGGDVREVESREYRAM